MTARLNLREGPAALLTAIYASGVLAKRLGNTGRL
jgi:hypothetical protein